MSIAVYPEGYYSESVPTNIPANEEYINSFRNLDVDFVTVEGETKIMAPNSSQIAYVDELKLMIL